MGVPTSEVGYTSATTGRGDHEVYKGHVVALGRKKKHRRAQKYQTIEALVYPSARILTELACPD
jgi:hypothetical protein